LSAWVTDTWAFNVREPLPVVPAPLKKEDEDVRLDLGAVLEEIYKRGQYQLSIDYRKPPPAPSFGEGDQNWMKELLSAIARLSDFEMELFESDTDHIHFLIRYIPRLSISSIVRRLKQQSTVAIWKKHWKYLSKHFWRERTFWSDGYFVCSIGEAAPDTIRQYILSQG